MLLPSEAAKAPVPPAGNSVKTKGSPRIGSRPAMEVMLAAPYMSPIVRSGSARPSAPMTSDSSARRTSPMAPQAAGWRAFTTLPYGAETEIGRKAPPLMGPRGSRNALAIV